MLEADGLDVVAEAGDARSACVEAARWLPDVVVLDVQLPDRSGFDIVEEITALTRRVEALEQALAERTPAHAAPAEPAAARRKPRPAR